MVPVAQSGCNIMTQCKKPYLSHSTWTHPNEVLQER